MGKLELWKCPKCKEATGAVVYRDVGSCSPIRIPFRYCKNCKVFFKVEMKEVKTEEA